MGLFSGPTVCGVCGKPCGINRYYIKKSKAWLCPGCLKKIGGLTASLNGKSFTESTIEEIREGFEDKCACKYDAETKSLILLKRNSMVSRSVRISECHYYSVKDDPVKTHYVSATVGGVTTGGFYTTGGGKVVNGSERSGYWKMNYTDYIPPTAGNSKEDGLIKSIVLTDELYNIASNSYIKKYLSQDRRIIVVANTGNMFRDMLGSSYSGITYEMHDIHSREFQEKVMEGYPDEIKCREIFDWINGKDKETKTIEEIPDLQETAGSKPDDDSDMDSAVNTGSSSSPDSKTRVTVTSFNEKYELIKKLKDLMDAGVITKEEFKKKRKEILGS